jgi:hypothetical protein
MTATAQSDGARAGAGLPAAGVLDELSGAFSSARAALAGFLELMALEMRRAGLALVWMAACGLIAAICMVAAWLGLMAAFALWAVALGFPPIAAAIAVAAINLVAAVALSYVCIAMSRDLLFSATRRQVAAETPGGPPAP